MSALTARQVSLLMRRYILPAWKLRNAVARGRLEKVDDSPAAFDAWRHAEVMRACGKAGLRLCDQRDFNRLRGHFMDLAGDHGGAFKCAIQAQTETRRQMEAAIILACERGGVALGYAEAICRGRSGLSLTEASDETIKQVLITLKSRLRARQRTTENSTKENS